MKILHTFKYYAEKWEFVHTEECPVKYILEMRVCKEVIKRMDLEIETSRTTNIKC